MSDLPFVSVVIPTFQRCRWLANELAALARQTFPTSAYEVIVSIDGSEDGTREMVAGFPAEFALIGLFQQNRGRAAACNAGLRAARGEFVIMLDDDMEPDPHFIEAHVAEHAGHSKRGVIGAAPIVVEKGASPVVRYVGEKFNHHLQKLSEPGYQLRLRDFYSGNFSIRRSLLLDVGGYDEAFRVYGNEDVELSLRLRRAGVELVYSARALATQRYTKDLASLARDHVHKGQTSVQLAHMHPEILTELKLGVDDQVTWRWRMARRFLLRLARIWPKTADAVLILTRLLEKIPLAPISLLYRFVLDYFYWLGVGDFRAVPAAAPRNRGSASPGPGESGR